MLTLNMRNEESNNDFPFFLYYADPHAASQHHQIMKMCLFQIESINLDSREKLYLQIDSGAETLIAI